jgi:hypothetical protein
MSAFDSIVNITDTLNQYGEAYSSSPSSPESDAYTVSEQELKERQNMRILFLVGLLSLIGLLIYANVKTK